MTSHATFLYTRCNVEELIKINIAPCIRVLLFHVSKITHIYFFYVGMDISIFFSSHSSSLIGLPFPPSFFWSVAFVHVTCATTNVYRDVRSDLVYPEVCSNFVTDHAVENFPRWTSWRTAVFWLCLPSLQKKRARFYCSNIDEMKKIITVVLPSILTAIAPIFWILVSTQPVKKPKLHNANVDNIINFLIF